MWIDSRCCRGEIPSALSVYSASSRSHCLSAQSLETSPSIVSQDRPTCGKLPTRGLSVHGFGISGNTVSVTPQFCFAKAVTLNSDKWARVCANKTLFIKKKDRWQTGFGPWAVDCQIVVSAHWLAQSSQVVSHGDGEEGVVRGSWEEIDSLFMGKVGGVTGKSEMPAATLYPKEASLGLRRDHTKWHHPNQTPDVSSSLTFPYVTHM